jgi:DNA topoisomerase-1
MTQLRCVVIVESAAKAAIITKYLNSLYPDKSWTVAACFGHIRDLPLKSLGVDTHTWEVQYELLATKKDVIAKLKKLSKDASIVYMAPDPDLEGHAIAHHLRFILCKSRPAAQCIRVTFNEITKSALKDAFDNPSGWNQAKVDAQETRRILDRVVGYKVSPLLWRSVASPGKQGLSAGRVQSAALAMIHKRFDDFNAHDPQKSWGLQGKFDDLPFSAKDDCTLETIELARGRMAAIVDIRGANDWDIAFTTKNTRKSPPAPFTTSTLQQEAYGHHKLTAKSTMALAQALYEEGFITYMRTDSMSLSADSVAALAEFVETSYGEAFKVSEKEKEQKKAKEKSTGAGANAQEAHEAIRPTQLSVRGADLEFTSHQLTAHHAKLYDLIWRRTVASQMSPAIYREISYTISKAEYVFKGKTSVMTFAGFLRVYSPSLPPPEDCERELKNWNKIVSDVKKVTMMSLEAVCTVSKPRLLYTETDLIKAMEKNGIGRPSTYVSIIEKLLTKGYCVKAAGPVKPVELRNIECAWSTKLACDPVSNETTSQVSIGGTDKDRMVPTDLGIDILQYLSKNIPSVLEVSFTSEMEANLDKVESRVRTKTDVLREFYASFEAAVAAAVAASTNLPKQQCTEKAYHDYAKWMGVSASTEDKAIIDTLPIDVYDDDERHMGKLMLGPYGMYVSTKDKKTRKVPQSLWSAVRDGTLTWEMLS